MFVYRILFNSAFQFLNMKVQYAKEKHYHTSISKKKNMVSNFSHVCPLNTRPIVPKTIFEITKFLNRVKWQNRVKTH